MLGRHKAANLIPVEKWPEPSSGPRVLVEEADGAVRWAYARILAEAGYDVACCEGPSGLGAKGRRRTRCPLLVQRRCALVQRADLVISNTSLPENPKLLDALSRENVALVVEGPAPVVEHETGRIGGATTLAYPVTRERLLAAVETGLGKLPALRLG